MEQTSKINNDFKKIYDEKNNKIIDKINQEVTITKALCALEKELGNAIKEDEQDLGRPLTYAEMRMRYG
jgi:hypothetical protein